MDGLSGSCVRGVGMAFRGIVVAENLGVWSTSVAGDREISVDCVIRVDGESRSGGPCC